MNDVAATEMLQMVRDGRLTDTTACLKVIAAALCDVLERLDSLGATTKFEREMSHALVMHCPEGMFGLPGGDPHLSR